jgi:hypothetical protein
MTDLPKLYIQNSQPLAVFEVAVLKEGNDSVERMPAQGGKCRV